MLLSLLYFAVRRLLHLLTANGEPDLVARDVEVLVLRHQLRVLSRGRRVPLGRQDRILLAAASRLLPRYLWGSFPVSPRTVLRSSPRACQAQVGLPAQAQTGSAENCEGGGGARPKAGEGEPALGLPADPG